MMTTAMTVLDGAMSGSLFYYLEFGAPPFPAGARLREGRGRPTALNSDLLLRQQCVLCESRLAGMQPSTRYYYLLIAQCRTYPPKAPISGIK